MTFASLADRKLSRHLLFFAIVGVFFFLGSHAITAHADTLTHMYTLDSDFTDSVGTLDLTNNGHTVSTSTKFSNGRIASGGLGYGSNTSTLLATVSATTTYSFSVWVKGTADTSIISFSP